VAQRYPRDWDWSLEAPPKPLSLYGSAPDQIGIYELGFMVEGRFDPQYVGRAKGVTLRQRLGQHFRHSHNPKVRHHRARLFFRCKVFRTEELAAYVEAVTIAALEYPWNRRNEWVQHWALEDM